MDSSKYSIPTPRRRLSLFVSDTFGDDLNTAFRENKPKSPAEQTTYRPGSMREDTPPPPPPSPVSWSKKTDYFTQCPPAYSN